MTGIKVREAKKQVMDYLESESIKDISARKTRWTDIRNSIVDNSDSPHSRVPLRTFGTAVMELKKEKRIILHRDEFSIESYYLNDGRSFAYSLKILFGSPQFKTPMEKQMREYLQFSFLLGLVSITLATIL